MAWGFAAAFGRRNKRCRHRTAPFLSAVVARLCCRWCQGSKTGTDPWNSQDCTHSCSRLWIWVHWTFAKNWYDVSTLLPGLDTFGRLMQNNIPIMKMWSKSKPKVEFQYDWHQFFQTGSSYSSAVDWAITTKLGFLIDFDLLKRATSPNSKLEVVLCHRSMRRVQERQKQWYHCNWHVIVHHRAKLHQNQATYSEIMTSYWF